MINIIVRCYHEKNITFIKAVKMSEKLVIDVGMHKGEDTEFYLKKGFKVVAIEANKELCDLVAENLKRYIESGQLIILNTAIVQTPGPTDFYINSKVSEWGTTQKKWVERNEKMGATSVKVTVEGITFEEVLRTYGIPYYLKIDIEGNDHLCLYALKSFLKKPDYLSIESVKTSWSELVDEFKLLKSLGYDRFKVVNQYKVPNQKSQQPPIEGRFVNHEFKFGSSGSFAEETPGWWLTQAFALFKYRWVFFIYMLVGNDGIFPNIHRKYPKNSKLKKYLHPKWYDTHAKRSRQ